MCLVPMFDGPLANMVFGSLFQPEDWDDEEDGEWTAPTIPNPEYKGPWKAKVCII